MDKLIVNVNGGFYEISWGPQIWAEVESLGAKYSGVFLVTDENVEKLYGYRLPYPRYILQAGEQAKDLASAWGILEAMFKHNLERTSLVVALGGGVVGDLAGFAASLFLRGVDYIQIPSTLLAQVDSSVGGKTGINTTFGKNLVGSFHQPRAVFVDPGLLKTLARREMINGLGELLKYGVVFDPHLFYSVSQNLEAVFAVDLEFLSPLIRRSLQIKSEIIKKDERDLGLRRILNYGHTLGHALEAATNYELYAHGEAVLIGMLYEARLALQLGVLPFLEYQKISRGLQRIELDWALKIPLDKLSKALLQDKKNKRGQISFLLPHRLGEVAEVFLSLDEFQKRWKEIRP